MLKLIKYDMIQSFRTYILALLSFLGLSVVMGFICRGDYILTNLSFVVMIYYLIASVLIVVMFVSIIYQFYKSMYSRNGYLTLTLPVSSVELVLSKVISTFIWFLIAFVFYIFSIEMLELISSGYSFSDIGNQARLLIESLLNINNKADVEKMQTIISYIGMVIVNILKIFFIVTVVNSKYVRKHKVIVGAIIYCVMNGILSFIGSIFSIFMVSDSVVLTTAGAVVNSYVNSANIFALIIQSILFFVLTVRLLDRHIEVE